MSKLRILLFALIFVSQTCCAGGSGKSTNSTASADLEPQRSTAIIDQISPMRQYRVGDTIKLEVVLREAADSLALYIDDERVELEGTSFEMVSNAGMTLGNRNFRFEAYRNGQKETRMSSYILRPTTAPKYYGYRVEKSYPHDEAHYTQGLIFEQGSLYEGTGMRGESLLAQIELSSGKKLRSTSLDSKYFGEGITLLDDKIYQLTWQEGKAFVYDINNFNILQEFDYQGEGWGLATDGQLIYMSNGTNKITVRDPGDFSILRTIEVYSSDGDLGYLNELEWIDGQLWANVYTTDYIARVDPATGLVLGYVDLKGLLPQADRTPRSEVLNGIAYDPTSKRIFVTGKYWSKLFEVSIFEK